jgi:hypothetical protein
MDDIVPAGLTPPSPPLAKRIRMVTTRTRIGVDDAVAVPVLTLAAWAEEVDRLEDEVSKLTLDLARVTRALGHNVAQLHAKQSARKSRKVY